MKINDVFYPQVKSVGGKSWLWHFHLQLAGYNELPESKKALHVTHTDDGGNIIAGECRALGIADLNIFQNEIQLSPP